MTRKRVGFYGDDFTGSVDVLLQFARHGWSGTLFVGLPDPEVLSTAARDHDVIGIAGIARSLPRAAIAAEVAPVLRELHRIGCDIVQYKACSTADSSPTVGSIGRVIEVARDEFGPAPIPVVFAQPDFGRYTVFGHHFAAENGTVYRLDRQPTMSQHPSTPMRESDLRVHLGEQTPLPIGGITAVEYATHYSTGAALAARLQSAPDAAMVLDVLDDTHLTLIGEAVTQASEPVFAIGSGGLSWGIASTDSRDSAHTLPHATPQRGPVLAVSGSRSPQTQRQIARAVASGWALLELPATPDACVPAITQAERLLAEGTSVVFSSHDLDLGSGEAALDAITETAAEIIRGAGGGAGRIIVCGGDTSSRIVSRLGIRSLAIAARPEGNIVLLRAHAPGSDIDGAELLLKGGQVGADGLFEQIRTLDA
ncbi:four-carbon acid sugar kinase family protein [Microbacterium sp. YY-01]|uniref:four-carbon acid sugar kinase family protein n=1 Tax=Microbacterium sp. YY-01 TaxID=3421634 RepID=UPI003D177D2F